MGVFTFFSAMAFLFLVVYIAKNHQFTSQWQEEAQHAFALATITPQIITEDDLVHVPPPVQRYLRYTGAVGKEKICVVRMRQGGQFRPGINQPWMPADVQQYTVLDPPFRLWTGTLKAVKILPVRGRDKFEEGHGHMWIKPLGVFTVADARGKAIDQASLMVFLNDMMMIPTALLDERIQWEEIDDLSAQATLMIGDVTATAVFHFNEEGQIINFVGERCSGEGDNCKMVRWSTPIHEYQPIHGYQLPAKGEVIWHYDEGDFCYFQVTLPDIEFNNPTLY